MEGNRLSSVIAGLIIGAISGLFVYSFIGNFLACGPYPSNVLFVDMAVKFELFGKAMRFGVIPGLFIGFWGGLVLPFTLPPGHFTKSISSLLFLIVTPLAWITYRHNLALMTPGKIAITAVMTLVLMIIILPMTEHGLGWLERIRYLGD